MRPKVVPGEAHSTSSGQAQVIAVRQEVDVGRARRAALALAEALGFNTTPKMEVGTAVSELAHNLVWHATAGGTITLRGISQSPSQSPGGRIGLEIVCEDKGPGIPDIAQAMQNGFSTSGGLGGGLPGTKRLMDEFSLESQVGQGTTIVARKWS